MCASRVALASIYIRFSRWRIEYKATDDVNGERLMAGSRYLMQYFLFFYSRQFMRRRQCRTLVKKAHGVGIERGECIYRRNFIINVRCA